jgi:predicted secreted Zn-dependent protease
MLPLSSPPKIEVPNPVVRQDTRYYVIEGRKESDLVREMNAKGYLNESSRSWGYTSPEVFWSYDVKRYGGQKCALVSPKVVVLITTTLPQWSPPPDTSAAVMAKWGKLDQALRHHEGEHAQISVREGEALVALMRGHSSDISCEHLNRYLQDAGRKILDQASGQNAELDRRTAHGTNEGVAISW